MPRKLLLLALSLSLAACVSGTKSADTYTDQSGKTTTFQTDREQCTASCNADYARCMDTSAAQNSAVNEPSGMFGASADCRDSLKSCLTSCKGR